MIKREYREEIYLIALVLLGLYLSLIENIIPKPFPWMKIGLSNISVLIALEKFNSKMALQMCIRDRAHFLKLDMKQSISPL